MPQHLIEIEEVRRVFLDRVGRAAWFSHQSTDMRLADVTRDKLEHPIEMAGIGYRYTIEEIGQAMMVPGTNLGPEKAAAARRAAARGRALQGRPRHAGAGRGRAAAGFRAGRATSPPL